MAPNLRSSSGVDYHLDCEQTRLLMDDYVDGELTPSDQRRVQGHLAGCAPCASFTAATLGFVRAARAALKPAEPPVGLADRLFARLGLRPANTIQPMQERSHLR
jgi:anti-sigma factor RsiW